jgi:hypothetical protein
VPVSAPVPVSALHVGAAVVDADPHDWRVWSSHTVPVRSSTDELSLQRRRWRRPVVDFDHNDDAPPGDKSISTSTSLQVAPPTELERTPSLYDAAFGVATAASDTDDGRFEVCVVCMERIANVLYKPCCHQALCTVCVTTYDAAARGCPLCRLPVGAWTVMSPRVSDADHPSDCTTWGTVVV